VWPGELALDLPRFGGRVIGRDTDNIKTGDMGLSLDEAKTLINAMAVEGTVNRLIGRRLGKGQHMCWTKRGAHLLLQVRCAVLNGELLHVINDGSRPSGPAKSGYRGIGYPTILNGSYRQHCKGPSS